MIDWTSPLAQGLDLCLACNEGAGNVVYDHVRQSPLAYNGTGAISWAGGVLGMAPTLPSTGYWTIAGAAQYTTQDFTLSWWMRTSSTSGFVVFSTGIFNTSGWYVQPNGDAVNNIKFATNQSGASQHNNCNGLVVGAWQHWTIVRQGSSVSYYLDGVAQVPSVSQAVTSPAPSPGTLYVNSYPNGTLHGTVGLDAVQFWSRALSAGEVSSVDAAPWQVFAPGPLRSWVFFQGSGAPSFMPWIFGDQIGANGIG
jgi:hypothetical protein